jgi:hypothetical protein
VERDPGQGYNFNEKSHALDLDANVHVGSFSGPDPVRSSLFGRNWSPPT